MIAPWLQDLVVWATIGAAVVALVRRFTRPPACGACRPRRAPPRVGIRPGGLTILP